MDTKTATEQDIYSHLCQVKKGLELLVSFKAEIQKGKVPIVLEDMRFSLTDGICWYMTQCITEGTHTRQGCTILHELPDGWYNNSGSQNYPVPSGVPHIRARTAYGWETENKWKEGLYGNYRWELVNFYINTLAIILAEEGKVMSLHNLTMEQLEKLNEANYRG